VRQTLDDLDSADATNPVPVLVARREVKRSGRLGRRALLWGAPSLALLVALDVASTHIAQITPDGATALLEGQSIASGNLGLRGWSLSLDSFWGIDAAFYALLVRLVGVRADLLHLVPALLATLVVLAAVDLAGVGLSRRVALCGAAVVIGLLALPSPDLAYFTLQGPWHIGTVLYCLLAFRCLASGRLGWAWAGAVVLLSVGLLGDLLIVAYGVAPCLFAGLAAMARQRRWRAGGALLAAVPASIALAVVIRLLAEAIGTFTLANRNIVVSPHVLWANVGHLPNRLAGLLGFATIPLGSLTNGAGLFEIARLAGALVVVAGILAALTALLAAVVRGPRGPAPTASWRIDDLLLAACVASLACFVWSSPSGRPEYTKYLTAGVIFAIVLAARQTGRLARLVPWKGWRRGVLALGVVVLCTYAGQFAASLGRAAPTQPAVQLTAFLRAHHLTNGIGDYWSAQLVTVDSHSDVTVRPVEARGTTLIRFDRQSSADWYDKGGFQFLAFDAARPWHGVNTADAIATYGRPAQTYVVGTYRVLVWSHRLTVEAVTSAAGNPLHVLWGLSTRPDRSAAD
jgi:hypothetical protein